MNLVLGDYIPYPLWGTMMDGNLILSVGCLLFFDFRFGFDFHSTLPICCEC